MDVQLVLGNDILYIRDISIQTSTPTMAVTPAARAEMLYDLDVDPIQPLV